MSLRSTSPTRSEGQPQVAGGWSGRVASARRAIAWIGVAVTLATLLVARQAAADDVFGPTSTGSDGAVSEFDPFEGCWPDGVSAPASPAPSREVVDPGLAVPICLPEGASGIAPLLVHALDGARLQGVPRCNERPATVEGARAQEGDELPRVAPDSQLDAAETRRHTSMTYRQSHFHGLWTLHSLCHTRSQIHNALSRNGLCNACDIGLQNQVCQSARFTHECMAYREWRASSVKGDSSVPYA